MYVHAYLNAYSCLCAEGWVYEYLYINTYIWVILYFMEVNYTYVLKLIFKILWSFHYYIIGKCTKLPIGIGPNICMFSTIDLSLKWWLFVGTGPCDNIFPLVFVVLLYIGCSYSNGHFACSYARCPSYVHPAISSCWCTIN